MGGEEELLVGIETHGLGDDTELHWFQILRTLCDNYDVGPILAIHRFPKASCWQQLVVDDQTVIVDEQDIDAWFHISVLEGIVEENDIDILNIFSTGQILDAPCTFPIHSHGDVGELRLHLIWLIPDGADSRVLVCQHKPFGLTLIASAQHGDLRLILQQSDQILHMGCLSRSADGDVTHGDDGNVEGPTFQDTHLKE